MLPARQGERWQTAGVDRHGQLADPVWTVGKVNSALQAINFIFMKNEQEFEQRLPGLIGVLNTDLDHVKQHTRVQGRALEWDSKNRKGSLTLRGDDLEQSEAWLGRAAGKQPPPTELQADYIQASRQQASLRQRRTLISVTIGLVLTLALAVLAAFAFLEAEDKCMKRCSVLLRLSKSSVNSL